MVEVTWQLKQKVVKFECSEPFVDQSPAFEAQVCFISLGTIVDLQCLATMVEVMEPFNLEDFA